VKQLEQAKIEGSLTRELILGLLSVVLALGMAYSFKWQTRDLVWSLWLSSLVFGYLTILSSLLASVLGALSVAFSGVLTKRELVAGSFIGGIGAAFFLGFFSFHFCGFHAGHAAFLSFLFPVENLQVNLFFDSFSNPLLLWKTVFEYLLKPYGWFLLPSLLVGWKKVFEPLVSLWGSFRSGADLSSTWNDLPQNPRKNFLLAPYKNVIRMHLLLFFFVACKFCNVDSFVIYAVVYLVYFLPIDTLKKTFKRSWR